MIRRAVWGLSALAFLLAGCLYPVGEKIDATVCDLASRPRDLQPLAHADETPAVPENPATPQPSPKAQPPRSGLTVPDELLPGGKVAPITLPPLPAEGDPQRRQKEQARQQALEKLFPPLPLLGEDLPSPPGPEGRPLTLADLQKLALASSPLVKQAGARVEEARGAAIQAGLPPNPNVGYAGDSIGNTGNAGAQGGFIEQQIKTGNKLQLARAAAAMDLRNAEVALFKAQTDLATKVRKGYFEVLVAQESIRLNRALVKFTTDVYQIQLEQVRKGFAAPYEPMYLRALATQARADLIQARNRRTAAWKQLAATLGLPGLPPAQLAGRLDVPVPVYDYPAVLAKVLAGHSDLRAAENSIQQAHYQLALAKLTPVPDVTARLVVQKDRTFTPSLMTTSLELSLPVPVWDRNQGGILQAQAALIRVNEEPHRVRTELTNTLSDAFERYQNSRVLLGYYRDRILPDLVRVYRGVYDRYQREPAGPAGSPPGFNDVVVAQQNLAAAIGNYIKQLGGVWQAVVDVADLLQTFDLFGVQGPAEPVMEIPDLEKLPELPCCHPCSPLPEQHHKVQDASWPSAEAPSPRVPKTPPDANPGQ